MEVGSADILPARVNSLFSERYRLSWECGLNKNASERSEA